MRIGVAACIGLVCACRTPIDDLDGAFYAWDGRQVHCSVEIDDRAGFSIDQILAGMDRAKDTGEVLELLVHRPGVSMTLERFEQVLAGVNERGLAWLTATDLVRGAPTSGVALMYDDWYTDDWVHSMELLAQYDARVTLYVAHYPKVSGDALEQLAAAGHDIEAHGVMHMRGPGFVEEYGLRTYLDDEVLPSVDLLRGDGYDVVSYAYPFGAHTSEMDRAILDSGSVQFVRSLAKNNELRANPCRY